MTSILLVSLPYSWFFGEIKRQEAERFLVQPGNSHGSFLIRRSDNRTGNSQNLFALSIRDGDLVRHYRIKATDSGRFFIARKSEFSTLSELVDYYTQSSDGLMVNLREPCVKVGYLPCYLPCCFYCLFCLCVTIMYLLILSFNCRLHKIYVYGQFHSIYNLPVL